MTTNRFAAKLVFNNSAWQHPTKLVTEGTGIFVPSSDLYFGLEEWLNHPVLKELKIGFIDCYRASEYSEKVDVLHLFTFNSSNKTVYHIGNMYGVKQIHYSEIEQIRQKLQEQHWLKSIEEDFKAIGVSKINEYLKIWSSNVIVGSTAESFMANVHYEQIELWDKKDWKNLTKQNPKVNTSWRRLSKRYSADLFILLRLSNMSHPEFFVKTFKKETSLFTL